MKLDDALNDALINALEEDETQRGPTPEELYDAGWRPPLNPVQRQAFDSKAKYILIYSERAAGKSLCGVEKLVDFCFNNPGAMTYIIVKELGQAKEGGAWTKLNRIVLPQWKDAIGLQYTDIKTDKDTQRPYIWITARNGELSMVILLSLYVGDHVEDKTKGKEGSFFLVDEAQTTESDAYFTELVQALGRTRVDGVQQIVYCANPKGQSHWIYQRFWVKCVDKRWGNRRKDYAVFHIPIEENKHNLPPGYWENVLEACRGDEIKTARMIRGEWVDEPEGDSVFGHLFNAKRHVRGEPRKNIGIHPSAAYPILVSYDLGSAHSSITFEQIIRIAGKEKTETSEKVEEKFPLIVFDELDFVGQWEPYFSLVPKLIRRLEYWNNILDGKAQFRHISDSSAFDQMRALNGSFDAKDIQDLSKKYCKEHDLPDKFRIKMLAAPKGPHTVMARVHMIAEKLNLDEIIISAMCPRAREMLTGLEEDREDRSKLKRSNHLHRFDSLSYAAFYMKLGKGNQFLTIGDSLTPEVYAVGGK